MYQVIKFNKYITVVKIPLQTINKFELVTAAQPREFMQSAFNRLDPKPDFMINGGLFDMASGTTLSTTVDNGHKLAEGYFSNFGLWVSNDNMFGFDYYNPQLDLKDFIGGSPSLIIDNVVMLDSKGLDGSFLNKRHPRSAIGINSDNFYFVAIDGRRLWAKGMTCTQLAQFMKDKLNCSYAINLDGGGSTRLGQNVDGKLKILNKPTENRSVDNFICCYLTKYKDLRVVTASRLNIRQSPNGTICGSYSNGTVIEVLETNAGWCRTLKGWVYGKYLRNI